MALFSLRLKKRRQSCAIDNWYMYLEHAHADGRAWSYRPQRRTALVDRELCRYKIEIAGPSETHLADVGEIKGEGVSYTFFWSRRKYDDWREAAVGFAIKTDLVGKPSGLPKGINGRLMTLALPLSGMQPS